MSAMSPPVSSSLLSSHELSEATRYLLTTRDGLVEAVSGLSDAQWAFRPDPDWWSSAGIVEHLVLIEDRVHAIVGQMQAAPLCEPDRVHSQVDEMILAKVPKRFTQIKAPEPLWPSQRWGPVESLARFVASRDRTVELLAEAPCLRGHVLPHPVLGLWDGYQWILAVAAHSARHTEQILEIKAHGGFPDGQGASSEPLH